MSGFFLKSVAYAIAAVTMSSCSGHTDESLSLAMAQSEMVRQADLDGLELLGFRRVAESSGDASLLAYAWADANKQQTESSYMHAMLANENVAYDDSTGLYRRRTVFDDTIAHAWALDNARILMSAVCLMSDAQAVAPDSLRQTASRLANEIITMRDGKTGLWLHVMDSPAGDANVADATASAMFTYALLKGSRTGVLPADMKEEGLEAFSHYVEHFIRVGETTGDGRNLLSIIGVHAQSGAVEVNFPDAIGAFLMACVEAEM